MKTKLSRMLFSIMFTLLVVAGGGLFGACASMEAKIEPEFPDEPSVVYSDALPLLVDGETLVRYIGEQNAIVDIPASYDIDENNNIIVGDTYKITKIADGAFKNVKFYDAYIDMSNVTEIGESAFENTKNITISEMLSLKKISAKAFYNSNINFKSLNLGNVEKIGKYSFSKTNKYEIPSNSILKPVYANDINERDGDNIYICSNNGICVVEDSAFYDYNIDNGEFRFGKGIAVIGDNAFDWCTGGLRCIFEGGTYYLGDLAFTRTSFYYCKLDGNFISVGDEIFKNCTNLNTVDIMQTANITTMNKNWFTGCTSLTKISRNADTNETSLSNNKGINFKYSSSFNAPFTSVGIPASVTSIEEGAFKGFRKLTSMELPFVGASTTAQTTTKYGVFGYIFGTQQYDDATLTNQEYESYYIPDSLKTINVYDGTELKAYSFCNCTNLTNVTIANTHTKIRDSSFYNCTGLTKFTIPEGVTIVGSNVFNGCTNLVALNIPSTITTSNDYENYWTTALDNCPKLTKVTRSTTTATSGGVINFNFAATTACGVKKFTVPNSVTQIDSSSFANFVALEELILPFIGYLKTTVPSSVCGCFGYIFGNNYYSSSTSTNQNYGTFYIPSSLKTVSITSAHSVSPYAFYRCSSLTSISIDGDYTSIGTYAFGYCTGLTTYTIKDGVNSFGNYVFSNCSNLDAVNIPSTIITGDFDFDKLFGSYCTKLSTLSRSETAMTSGGYINLQFAVSSTTSCDATSVIVPNWINMIWESTFNGFSDLTSITLPFVGIARTSRAGGQGHFGYIFGYNQYEKSTKVTGYYSYSYIPDTLNTVIITDDTVVPSYAFYNCKDIDTITIQSTYTEIGNSAFYYCESITDFVIPNSVQTIEDKAFYGCSGLTKITVPYGVASIKSKAFANCSNLEAINLPKSLNGTTMQQTDLFDASLKLTKITRSATEATSGGVINFCFAYTDSFEATNSSLSLPSVVTEIYASAFRNYSSLRVFNVSTNLNRIGDYAFYQTGITSIVFPSTSNATQLRFGKYSFARTNISTLIIPYYVNTTICLDSYCFKSSNLSAVQLSRNISKVDEGAFEDNELYNLSRSTENVLSGSNYLNLCWKYGGSDSICSCTIFHIPSSVYCVQQGAFDYFTNLQTLWTPVNISQRLESDDYTYSQYDRVLFGSLFGRYNRDSNYFTGITRTAPGGGTCTHYFPKSLTCIIFTNDLTDSDCLYGLTWIERVGFVGSCTSIGCDLKWCNNFDVLIVGENVSGYIRQDTFTTSQLTNLSAIMFLNPSAWGFYVAGQRQQCALDDPINNANILRNAPYGPYFYR